MTVDMTPDVHTYDGVPALWNNVPGGMATLASDQMRMDEAIASFNAYNPVDTYNYIPQVAQEIAEEATRNDEELVEALSTAAFEWFSDWPLCHVIKYALVFADNVEHGNDVRGEYGPIWVLYYMAVRAVEERLFSSAIALGYSLE